MLGMVFGVEILVTRVRDFAVCQQVDNNQPNAVSNPRVLARVPRVERLDDLRRYLDVLTKKGPIVLVV
ncbi:MAG: hypothetical protein HY665_01285 [Chloroflexi bacterium]|nr:hypothetical protein [Chloroflexota bacterium]